MVFSRLENRVFKNDNETFLHLILLFGLALAVLIHSFFLIFFLIANKPLFIFMNSVSLIVYAIVYFLHSKKHYTAVGLLLTIEISLYTFFASYIAGLETGAFTFYFIVLLIQAIIPYGKAPVRVGASIYLWLCLTTTLILGSFFPPLSSFPESLSIICLFINVQTTFIGVMIVLVVADYIHSLIAEYRNKKIEEYREKAHRDPLTGQYNRHYADYLWTSIPREVPYVIAMLDLDDFKKINDKFGHNVGDEVLITVADIINSSLRASDTIIRWGGEEFLILLQNIDLETAEIVLNKLREAVHDHIFTTEKGPFSISVSIGASPLEHSDIQGSIVNCDRKLYESKHSGKDHVSL